MDQYQIFKNLREAQIRDLNSNRDQLVKVSEDITRLRTELAIAEGNYDNLMRKRQTMLVSARGVNDILRAHETAIRQEEERAEDEKYV